MKVYIVIHEGACSEGDSVDAAFSTMERAEAYLGHRKATFYGSYNGVIQELEVDNPD